MDFYHIDWFVLFWPAILLSVFAMAIMYKLDRRHPNTPIAWHRVLGVSIAVFLVLCAVIWMFEGRQAFKESRMLFDSPISEVQSIRITPIDDHYLELVHHEITITNRSNIQEIMTAIRGAKSYWPEHPDTRWQCFLVISNTSGVISIRAAEVLTYDQSQGVTELNPLCDSLSNNAVGDILEKLAGYNVRGSQ